MNALPVTTATGGLLGLICVVLAARVIIARGRSGISLGAAAAASYAAGEERGASHLMLAQRAHANFCEYAPLGLILLGLVELAGWPSAVTVTLAGLLVIGRLLHPFGLARPMPNLPRGGGIVLNMIELTGASALLLASL